jgi:WD40 repeat protein
LVVIKCLEKNRTRRYATAGELVADLERFLKDEPVIARPPSWSYRLGKAWKRNKGGISAAAAILLSILGGAAFSFWQAAEAKKAQREAQNAQKEERAQRIAAEAARRHAEISTARANEEKASAQRNLYAARMNLLQQSASENNQPRWRQLLDQTASFPERSFEWFYWKRAAFFGERVFNMSDQPSGCLAFAGGKLTTASGKSLLVWDPDDDAADSEIEAKMDGVTGIAASSDGRWIACAGMNRVIKIFDPANPRLTRVARLPGFFAAPCYLAASKDGTVLLSGCPDGVARGFSPQTGAQLFAHKLFDDSVISIAISPDGLRYACSGKIPEKNSFVVKIMELKTGREIAVSDSLQEAVKSMAFSPDGKRLLTGGDDSAARLWDAETGKQLAVMTDHNWFVTAVAFSPDGKTFATGSRDWTVKLRKASDASEIATFEGHSPVVAVAFSNDSSKLAAGCGDGTVKMWDLMASSSPSASLEPAPGVIALGFSPDGKSLVTGHLSPGAIVWNLETKAPILHLNGHSAAITCSVYSPDGLRIATSSDDKSIKLWNASTGLEEFTLAGHGGSARTLAFNPAGTLLASGGDDATVRVWDLESRAQIIAFAAPSQEVPVVFSPDGRRLATATSGFEGAVWDLHSRQEVFRLKGHSVGITSIAYSPDGLLLATGSRDSSAQIWDAATGKLLLTLEGSGGPIWSVDFSPDNLRLVTGGSDKTARIWDVQNGAELLRFTGAAYSKATFSKSGLEIAALDGDAVRIWKSATGEELEKWESQRQRANAQRALRTTQRAKRKLEMEQRQSETMIKNWLVLGPIPLPAEEAGQTGLDYPLIADERKLAPRSGDQQPAGAGPFTWNSAKFQDGYVDLNRQFGRRVQKAAAYCLCYIHSDQELHNLKLSIGSDDALALYLNGEKMFQSTIDRVVLPGEDSIEQVTLKQGRNTLLLKMLNRTGHWRATVSLSNSEGGQVPGIQFTP